MQIEEKYKKDYKAALEKFRAERSRYIKALCDVENLRVIPSQANYVMAEITNGMTATELTRVLIIKHNILIKNLIAKIHKDNRQYIRLDVKSPEENDRLVAALKEELKART